MSLIAATREVASGRALARAMYALEERSWRSTPEATLDQHIRAVLAWLLHAQGATPDDGVAQGYNAISQRWGASYPETTGYIISSLLDAADAGYDTERLLTNAAVNMGRWLVTTQLPDGAFPGGSIAQKAPKPAVFNTGQILEGFSQLLSRGLDETGAIAASAQRAAQYMMQAMDADGCWRSGISALTTAPVHAYNVRAAWGLALFGKHSVDERMIAAAQSNANWVCRQQREDHWFDHMNFDVGQAPLTHTIAYTIQGLLEIGAMTANREMMDRAREAAEEVFARQDTVTGAIPGQFDERWTPVGEFTSMTGNAQMAIIGHRLAALTGNKAWSERALRANAVCKRFQELDHRNPNRRGAVRGCYPSNGGYGTHWYMNWTQKFFLDALLCERAAGQ